MATPEEIKKKNIEESNAALGEAINLTSRLADVMADIVKNTKNKGELDKGSLNLSRQAVEVTRNLSTSYSSINDVQKDIAKNQKKQQDIQKQIIAITKDLTDKEKASLETFRKKSAELDKAKSIEQSLIDKQKQGKSITDDQIKRAQELIAKKEEQAAIAGKDLSSQAEQIVALEGQGRNLQLNNEYLEEQRKRQENIRKGMGAFGRAAEGAQKTLEKFGLGQIGKALGLDAAAAKAKEMSERLTEGGTKSLSAFSKLKILFGSLGAALKSALGPIAIIGMIASAYNKGKEAAERLSGQNVELARTLGVAQSTANKLAGEVRGIGASMGITGGQATAAAGAIYSNLDGVEKLSKSTLETFVKLNVFAGMSAESIGDIRRLSKLTGEDTGKVAEQMALTAQESIKTQKVNVSMKSVMEGVGKVSNTIKLAFKGSAEELTRAFVSSKKLGLELKQVDDIANSLLNFEDSIAAEMEAELLTGKQLNLEKAREAALNNDIEGVMEEISKQGIDQASFTKMNRIQQDAVAKSIGMSRDGLADMLVGQKENTAENTELMDTQKQGLAAMQSMSSVSEQLAANEEARANQFAIIFELLNPIVEAFKNLGPLVLTFITPIVEQLVPVITKLAENLFPAIQRLITSLAPIVTKLLEALMPVFDVIVELAIKLLPVIQQIFDAIIPVVMNLLDALMPIIDAVVELAKVLLPIVVEVFKSLMPILLPIFKVIEGIANFITGIIEGDFNKVGAGLKKIGEGLLNLIMGIFEGLINLAIGVFEGIVQSIPGFGDTTFERVDFDDIKLATGGIVEGPTRALIGEAGPEAVVPLNSDKSMNVFSKSLEEKLDRLIAAVEKGGVVMLDGQKVGEALVVNSYRTQ